jgi:hypothetical protein
MPQVRAQARREGSDVISLRSDVRCLAGEFGTRMALSSIFSLEPSSIWPRPSPYTHGRTWGVGPHHHDADAMPICPRFHGSGWSALTEGRCFAYPGRVAYRGWLRVSDTSSRIEFTTANGRKTLAQLETEKDLTGRRHRGTGRARRPAIAEPGALLGEPRGDRRRDGHDGLEFVNPALLGPGPCRPDHFAERLPCIEVGIAGEGTEAVERGLGGIQAPVRTSGRTRIEVAVDERL